MGDENPIRTLGDYSKPSHEGYRNTIELPVGNNVVPLRSDTIRLVQNGCSFHGLRSEDPNQHLKDFLKLVDSLDLDGENRERTRLRLFQFSLRDQASNWLERLPAGSISTWEDLTTRFLAQFFPLRRTAKLRNDILMFQQHHGESLSEAWTRFKDLLQKVPHHGIDRWLQIQIFYDHVSFHLKCEIDRPSPQPQALVTTFEARVRDYMAVHTERMEIFENTIFKQRKEINGRMTEMFGLLKELTTSRTPEKILIREEAKFPVTKNVNSISLTKGEEEGSNRTNVTPENAKKLTKLKMETPVIEVEKINEVENGVGNKSIKTSKSEEAEEVPGSQPVAYYLKHKINENMIKGLVNNNKFNNSRLRTQAGKKKGKEYKVLTGGPAYDVILKKKITKKEDIGGNVMHVNVLVDQGSDVNVMPYSTYMKLTDERPVKTDIRLSLASHSLVLEWEEKIKLHLEREMQFNQWRSKNFKGMHPTLIATKEGMDDEGEVT
ncbi:MAK10-like protein [Tanacetum coccineum]